MLNACEAITDCSSEPSTIWPWPVRSRWNSATITPYESRNALTWSAKPANVRVGGVSGSPVTLMTPPRACASGSSAGRCASGPLRPNPDAWQ